MKKSTLAKPYWVKMSDGDWSLLSENQQLATIQLYQLQRTKLNPTDYIECAACHGTGKVKRAAE